MLMADYRHLFLAVVSSDVCVVCVVDDSLTGCKESLVLKTELLLVAPDEVSGLDDFVDLDLLFVVSMFLQDHESCFADYVSGFG